MKTTKITPSIDELKSKTSIFDALYPKIQSASSLVFREYQKVLSKITDKNLEVLQTNIIGKQLLINEKDQETLLNVIGVSKKEALTAINNSEWIKSIGAGSLKDQLAMAIPIIMFAHSFAKVNKKDEAEFIYFSMFLKPYASRISQFFKYGVNERQMLYTIEHMSARFDIKNAGSVFEFIRKIAGTSFENYYETLKTPISDYDLYTITTGGCYTRVNISIKSIMTEYMKNKGKFIGYENSTFVGTDEDSEGETFDNEIMSDSQVKTNITSKTVSKIIKTPIDEKILDMAGKVNYQKAGFPGTFGKKHREMLRHAITEMVENEVKEIPEIIMGILDAFTHQTASNGKKLRASDIKGPMFVNYALKTFRQPNSTDSSVIKTRDKINKLLTRYSVDYANKGDTLKRFIRDSIILYFILLIKE